MIHCITSNTLMIGFGIFDHNGIGVGSIKNNEGRSVFVEEFARVTNNSGGTVTLAVVRNLKIILFTTIAFHLFYIDF